jgi:hypothetical protein
MQDYEELGKLPIMRSNNLSEVWAVRLFERLEDEGHQESEIGLVAKVLDVCRVEAGAYRSSVGR